MKTSASVNKPWESLEQNMQRGVWVAALRTGHWRGEGRRRKNRWKTVVIIQGTDDGLIRVGAMGVVRSSQILNIL